MPKYQRDTLGIVAWVAAHQTKLERGFNFCVGHTVRCSSGYCTCLELRVILTHLLYVRSYL